MKFLRKYLLVLLAALMTASPAYAQGPLLVRFGGYTDEDKGAAHDAHAIAGFNYELASELEAGGTNFEGVGNYGWYRVTGGDPASLARIEGVEVIEPELEIVPLGWPTDPLTGLQWALTTINMQPAWDNGPLSANPRIVAIIDSGIDTSHQDLVGRWGIPTDYPCAIEDANNPNSTGWYGHGTFIAGLIAANSALGGSPSVGIAGVTPEQWIFPLRFLECPQRNGAWPAVDYAWQHGASVISISLGGPAPGYCPTYWQDAI